MNFIISLGVLVRQSHHIITSPHIMLCAGSYPYTLKETIEKSRIAQNGRFKLYPTDNMYNFIMVDVINGNTYQVQWNIDRDKRFVMRFW